MSSTIHQKVKQDMQNAMKKRDIASLDVLRGIITAFTHAGISAGKTPRDELSDQEAITVLKTLAKQRRESIDQFTRGGRIDLVDKEKKELAIINAYLPQAASKEEIKKIIQQKKIELSIENPQKAGVLIGAVMKELKGNADGATVKKLVDECLR